jgi:ubiquitin-activating enzyme E1
MDTIEKSNLSRQFLFRNSNIGKFKSETAMEAVKKINPDIKVTAHRNKVGVETLDIYNEKFFKNLLCVANALDNVQARLFVDQLCLAHGVPLLESGTLGAKGNVQTIIPHLTESYGSTVDPPEQSVPVCTLKNFPYQIEHTIQYSRDIFEGYFNKAPTNYNKYMNDKLCVNDMTPTELAEYQTDIENVLNNLGKPFKYKHCVQYAFNVWHENYRYNIEALIKKFPVDHKNDDGTVFWSGSKRCPKPSEFDINNETHIGFVHAFANLWANVCGLDSRYCTIERTIKKIKKIKLPVILIESYLDIASNDEEEKKRTDNLVKTIDKEEIIKKLENIKLRNTILIPQNFEKDDDTNFHIAFVTHASNMRAENYLISLADKFKTKGIAGKIIPALATTTSLVSGLVGLEVYKVLLGYNKIEQYRNSYINFGTSFFGFTEPSLAKPITVGTLKYTIWDNFTFKNIKVSELMTNFEKYDVEVTSISCGNYMLISPILNTKKITERKEMDIISLYKLVSGNDAISPLRISLMIDKLDDDNDNIDIKNDTEIEPILCKIEF